MTVERATVYGAAALGRGSFLFIMRPVSELEVLAFRIV